MTGILPPQHMYAPASIHFRDPFVSKDSYHAHPKASWSSSSRPPDLLTALTPPPEMNGVSLSTKPGYHQQEYGHQYGGYVSSQQTCRASVAPQHPQEASTVDYSKHGVNSQPGSRPMSPVTTARPSAWEDYPQQSRRSSLANAIAPSFQIPRSVNDSGGSLSELAAQITCLFWFESSDVLQQVEDSPVPIQPLRQLTPDAKPTTGFRKWVTTILSTTLVAQNVVLLALLFVYRLKKLNPTVRGKPGSEYRLLTVALMLGNKFLDDNTYTNKTWAEVSGINVTEVHIMEVEFLSNMKYCLFTSAEDWAQWQSLLGRFATFFERASRPIPIHPPAPVLPPASSLRLPMALPSPPASNQASPQYLADPSHNGVAYSGEGQNGPTPAPSPLPVMPNNHTNYQPSRKRSVDEYATEPAPKRIALGHPSFLSPRHRVAAGGKAGQSQQIPRLTLPSLSIPPSQFSSGNYAPPPSLGQQLPPLNMPSRALTMVFPSVSSQAQAQQLVATSGPGSQPPSQGQSQYHSRQQSPYPVSAGVSPTTVLPQSASSFHAPAQISPSYFLRQRNSPYRPVHNVSTLLYPPPSSALQNRPQSIEFNQMHYQPLGKPIQQRQSGHLPYVAQNVWLDGNHQQAMTPVHQWPSFAHTQQLPVPTPH